MAKRTPRRELPPEDELDDELDDDLDEEFDDDVPVARPRKRRRNWRLRFALLLLLIAALAAAAPTIVAKSPLRNTLLGQAVAGSGARLAARDASFSWLGAQGLAGITLVDAQGSPLATIELLTVDRSLVSLASNSRSLGKVTVLRPVVHLESREGGSNFEDLAHALEQAARQRPPSSAPQDRGPTTAEVEIIDGVVLGRDAATGQEWRIDDLDATAQTTPSGELADFAGAGVLTLTSGPFTPAANRGAPDAGTPSSLPPDAPGRFKIRLTPNAAVAPDAVTPADVPPASPEQHLELIADRLPLAPLEPWLARVLPGSRITGATSADLKLAWTLPTQAVDSATASQSQVPTPQPLRISAIGKLDAANLRFTTAALEGDLVELPAADLAVDATWADGKLSARQLKVHCDWFDAEAAGDFNVAQLTRVDLRELPAADAVLTARVDLPQLARMLPRTLKLRPGVRIDSGNVEVTARSARTNEGRRWTVAASIENLLGADGKRAIRWSQPVEAGLDAAESPTGPQLKRIILRSAFASATAEAVDEGFQGQLEFNLSQLADQLGQFVDLSAWKLVGTGKGDFTLRNTGDDRFVAAAKLALKDIDVRNASRIVWVDPEVTLQLNANGRRFGLRPQRLDTATALVKSPRDTLQADLLAPVDLSAANGQWSLRIKGDGPLDFWAGRVRPWVAGVPDALAGAATIDAEVSLGAELVEVAKSQLAVREFRTRVGDVDIIEPRLEASGDLRWSAADRAIKSQDLQLASSTIAARIRGLSLQLADAGPPTLHGDIAFRGDLERMAAWAGLTGAGATVWPRGQAVGRVQLASDAQHATALVTLTATPFLLVRAVPTNFQTPTPGHQPSIAWDEPKLELSANAVYTHGDDRLNLSDIRLRGKTVQMNGVGSIDQTRTAGLVRGDVNVTFDAAELARLLAGYLGPGVRFEGANTARLQATGRLRQSSSATSRGNYPPSPANASSLSHWSRRWQVTAEAGWNAANLYGLPIGAARLGANVRDGELAINPLDLPIGQGRITASPHARLDPPPQVLTLPPGPLVSNVAISREVSEAMLKYAAPVLANATRSEGAFSVFLDSGAQMPLGAPSAMVAEGRLTIHRLAIMPGPMLQDVINLISRMQAIAKAKNRPGGLLGGLIEPPAAGAAGAKGVTMTERTIDVKVEKGRVYHRNLEFLVDDVPVRSYGSVGFDQTISLMIEVPVQAKWVGSERALQPLIGQIIQIPVSGTFSKWKIDERAIGNFLAQAAQTAVGGAIEGELGKALDKLFKQK
jgi:hypothetical protein